ncbi:hypothetical protein D3C80_1875660 [compost metagenome]
MQLVAIAAGDIGKHGDHVFLFRRFVDDHLIFQRFQTGHQQLVSHVDRLTAADVIQRPLQHVFAIFRHIQRAAFGQYGFQTGDRRGLHVCLLNAQAT